MAARGWITIVVLVAAIATFSVRAFAPSLWTSIVSTVAPERQVAESNVPEKADLPSGGGTAAVQRSAPANLGTFPQLSALDLQHGCTNLPEVRWGHWFWNTHMGAISATGGKQAAQGSRMCANGVNLKLTREDDVEKQKEGLATFAEELASGNPHPKNGFHFISLMGDGTAAIFAPLNDTLAKLGPGYGVKVVASGGYSRGEDAFMGPQAWKDNPQMARGGVVIAYLKDGDWNIVLKWLGDNGLCNNPDDRTYDPDCVNWIAADTYITAAQQYAAGYCEADPRPVVRKGKKTGETAKVCAQAVATWTPGDNIAADGRGGIVRIVSTAEYRYQMPMVVVGIDKWMSANRPIVEGFVTAMLEENERLLTDDAAMRRAAALSALVYNGGPDEDAAYVYKYFYGATEPDKTGVPVQRGGSSLSNLADNCQLFGLQSCAPGSTPIYKAVYTTFGNIVKQQYPQDVPSYPPYESIVDTSYLEAVAQRKGPAIAKADLPTFSASQPVTQMLSRKAWHINFASGAATFSNGASGQLQQLLSDLVIAGSLAVEVHGHTDATGSPDGNHLLSEQRAFAVKQWLETRSPANFPSGRVRVFAHGQQNPVAPNTTPDGKAFNRRVEVILGTLN